LGKEHILAFSCTGSFALASHGTIGLAANQRRIYEAGYGRCTCSGTVRSSFKWWF